MCRGGVASTHVVKAGFAALMSFFSWTADMVEREMASGEKKRKMRSDSFASLRRGTSRAPLRNPRYNAPRPQQRVRGSACQAPAIGPSKQQALSSQSVGHARSHMSAKYTRHLVHRWTSTTDNHPPQGAHSIVNHPNTVVCIALSQPPGAPQPWHLSATRPFPSQDRHQRSLKRQPETSCTQNSTQRTCLKTRPVYSQPAKMSGSHRCPHQHTFPSMPSRKPSRRCLFTPSKTLV